MSKPVAPILTIVSSLTSLSIFSGLLPATPSAGAELLPDLTSELRIGASVRKFDYLEGETANDSEKGTLPGMSLGYHAELTRVPTYLDLSVDGIKSFTTYDGSDDAHQTTIETSMAAQLLDAQAEVGYRFLMLDSATSLSTYTGLGYHYWRRGQIGDASGVATYREDYTWWVFPMGLRLDEQLSDRLSLSVDLQARLSFAGSLLIHTSELKPSYTDTKAGLGMAVGGRFELPFRYRLGRSWGVLATPWLEYSAIGSGDPVSVLDTSGQPVDDNYFHGPVHEPASRTYQYGGTLGATLRI